MTHEFISCNLCGSNKSRPVASFNDAILVSCKECGLIFRNPRPVEEEVLEDIASDGVFVEHQKKVWHDSKMSLFRKNLQRIERFMPFKGKLLDVGCGYGLFLWLAQKNHWQACGVEPSHSAYEYAKKSFNLDVCKGTLKQACFNDSIFDAVTFWEVLGVVPHPLEELKEAHRVLKENGLIALRLQNGAFNVWLCRLFKVLGNIDLKLELKATVFHLYNFTPSTIKKMLLKSGFKDIRFWVSEYTCGDPYGTGGKIGTGGVNLIKKAVYFLCQCVFYLSFGLLLIGPSFLVFAKKSHKHCQNNG
jgi:ubiquinone/menaquinone biosynthesis C-methylase UbiE